MVSSGEVGISEKHSKKNENGGTKDSNSALIGNIGSVTTNRNDNMENRNAEKGKPVNNATDTSIKDEGRRGPTPKPDGSQHDNHQSRSQNQSQSLPDLPAELLPNPKRSR